MKKIMTLLKKDLPKEIEQLVKDLTRRGYKVRKVTEIVRVGQ